MGNSAAQQLTELAKVFFKLGLIGFGGPAAHIAMMQDEVVNRRQWLTQEQFLDLVGATNLIPGPNSTEMAIHIGYIRAGWRGLIVAGVCFIIPAVLITGGFAWVYVRFGKLPSVALLFYGIKPAVLAIVLSALWRLGKTAVKDWQLLAIALVCVLALFLGLNEVLALLLGGLLGMVWLRNANPGDRPPGQKISMAIAGFATTTANFTGAVTTSVPVPLWQLGLFFLKVGSVLYGGGYVLVAFLEGELVQEYGWLTQQQLLDAIAIGQFTPGPILSTATFIGYLIAGWWGAFVATIGIFLPSFFFVAALNPLVPRLRSSRWMSAFLDAVNVCSVALMAVVTLKLARATLSVSDGEAIALDWGAVAIAVVAAVLGIRLRVNAAWLVLGGALAGLILKLGF